jgi:hypothetical protein
MTTSWNLRFELVKLFPGRTRRSVGGLCQDESCFGIGVRPGNSVPPDTQSVGLVQTRRQRRANAVDRHAVGPGLRLDHTGLIQPTASQASRASPPGVR